ncbi:UNVERIFIED_CONTAM: hypothetical protein FKN15_070598 [Acipenser sinensis]
MEMDSYESDHDYENVDINKPPSRRAGAQHGESAAHVDSSDRPAASCGWAVWLLIALSCLLLAASVALGVLYFKLSESHSGLQGGYSSLNDMLSELQRNYSRLSEFHSQLQRNYGRVQDENSDLKKMNAAVCVKSSTLDLQCTLKEGSSKERVCKACPVNWVESNGKCYYFSTDTMDWHSSRANCVSMGADLVIIESEAEQVQYCKHSSLRII